jgi:hypothetical protein
LATCGSLFMSEALITRTEGQAGIVLSRRLEDESGAFAGVEPIVQSNALIQNVKSHGKMMTAPTTTSAGTTKK